ncbi:MAG: hypothetical protein WD874_00095 [Parcubacteria group bacterium]
MGKSADAGRFIVPQNDSRNRSGHFFEQLGLAIVGGEINREHRQFGDIVNDELSLGVEVKAGDSNNGLGIRVGQKRMYEEVQRLGFPYSHFAYLLCCYVNESSPQKIRGKRSPRPLSLLKNKWEKYSFFARDVNKVFLLDLAVMNALEKKVGITTCRHPEREEEEDIRIRRRELEPFCNGNGTAYLKTLGLDPRKWLIGKYDLGVSVEIWDSESDGPMYYSPRFPFYTVLPAKFHHKFQKLREFIPSP